MTDPRAEVEALREDRETIAAYREVHYYIGPSLSPDNLDDSGQCSCGQDDECDILTLLAILARPAPPSEGLDGVGLITAERRRQIEVEGWTPERDSDHDGGGLARAAATYALPADRREEAVGVDGLPEMWPWDAEDWKPTPNDRIRELVKAGALVAAEIDRLVRDREDEALTARIKALRAALTPADPSTD